MNCAILASKDGWHVQVLARVLERRGGRARRLPVEALVGCVGGGGDGRPDRLSAAGAALDRFDAVIVRAIPSGSLEQVIFRMDALHRLERLGVPIVNPPCAIERTVDKYFTSTLVEDAGLPTPPSVVCERFEQAMVAFEALGGDVVVKPLFGAEGRGMVRVTDLDMAHRVFRALELTRAVFYLQRFIPHANQDIRAFVVAGEVVAAMRRQGVHWKTNVAQGGRAEFLQLSSGLAELAVQAAAVVGAPVAGVDLLPAETGETYVIEVNGIPGWRGLQRVTPFDIAEVIVDYIDGQ
ncbi:MAG: RimK family alpha-L-glutamate ligase [Ardenticatenaceae bacterium]|nr:RimK family alpha-L-glutamate ligase [Ardenticatenaceae bacterium]